MLNHRILLMNDGLDDNVIKIKPPLCFTKDNADAVLQAIDKTLEELLNWSTWLVNFLYFILHCTTIHITLFILNVIILWMTCLCKDDVHQKPYFICVCRRVDAAWAQWFLSSSSRAFACKEQQQHKLCKWHLDVISKGLELQEIAEISTER